MNRRQEASVGRIREPAVFAAAIGFVLVWILLPVAAFRPSGPSRWASIIRYKALAFNGSSGSEQCRLELCAGPTCLYRYTGDLVTREEFAELALSYLDEVAAFARRLTSNVADADDLVQITFERAFGAWSTLRERGACRTWLFRIARNAYLNLCRTETARPALRLVDVDERDDLPTISAETVERLDADELERALTTLTADQREALLLSDLWGFTYVEIAEIAGIPVGTVRSRIARARSRVMAEVARTARVSGRLGRTS